jgi:diacylglycerol kinase family enzyme
MRVTLIHNAGAGDDDQPSAKQLSQLIRNAGHALSYRSTDDDDWAAALNESADLIAVAGGDGTIGRVARRMAGGGIPLAVLPMGTANNISRTLGLVDLPFEKLIASWHLTRIRKLDVGIAKGPWGRRRFTEGLGVGVFALRSPASKPPITRSLTHCRCSRTAWRLVRQSRFERRWTETICRASTCCSRR